MKDFGLQPLRGALRYHTILRQDTIFSQCLSSPKCIREYRQFKAVGTPAMDSHLIQGGVEIRPVVAD